MIDPREKLLSAVTTRLAQLLRESEDQKADRHLAEAMLREAGLYEGIPRDRWSPYQFAADLIEDNPLLFDVIGDVRTIYDPANIETVEDLILHAIPSDGHLE